MGKDVESTIVSLYNTYTAAGRCPGGCIVVTSKMELYSKLSTVRVPATSDSSCVLIEYGLSDVVHADTVCQMSSDLR